MSRPRGNLALVPSREPEADIDIDVSEAVHKPALTAGPLPLTKPCRFCKEEMDFVQDPGVYLHDQQVLMVCPQCNQGMARLPHGGGFRCVQCQREVSFKD